MDGNTHTHTYYLVEGSGDDDTGGLRGVFGNSWEYHMYILLLSFSLYADKVVAEEKQQ